MKKILKMIFGSLGVIIVGAVGSGVWEKILSPAWTLLISYVANVSSRISSTYENSIYDLAARDVTNIKSLSISNMIVYICGLYGIFYFIQIRLNARAKSDHLSDMLKKTFDGLLLALSVTLLIASMKNLSKFDAAITVEEDSIRSFEILRPYITNNEYYVCRSMFYSMQSKQDFDRLVKYVSGLRLDVKVPLNKYLK